MTEISKPVFSFSILYTKPVNYVFHTLTGYSSLGYIHWTSTGLQNTMVVYESNHQMKLFSFFFFFCHRLLSGLEYTKTIIIHRPQCL